MLHCQVLLWEVTQNGIKLASQFPLQSHPCFEVAGQINSIDTRGEYAAVGSAVVQLVKLTDFALNKRILVHKSMKSMVLGITLNGWESELIGYQMLATGLALIWPPAWHALLPTFVRAALLKWHIWLRGRIMTYIT